MSETSYPGVKRDRTESERLSRAGLQKNLTEEVIHQEDKWQSYDSPLLEHEHSVPVSFQEFFGPTLPPGVSLKEYIVREFCDRARQVIGVEFGGPGSRLFSQFPEGFFERTLGVTLIDHRTDSHQRFDNRRNHTVIASTPEEVKEKLKSGNIDVLGDLAYPPTVEAVRSWLAGRKIDVIFERMMGGLNSVPKNPYYIASFISDWYKMLSENGVMFIEIPSFMDPLIESWKKKIKQEAGDYLELQVQPFSHNFNSSFRLQKRPGAPTELPLLLPREVRQAYKPNPKHHLAVLGTLLKKIGVFS